jgi:hypothetical protein
MSRLHCGYVTEKFKPFTRTASSEPVRIPEVHKPSYSECYHYQNPLHSTKYWIVWKKKVWDRYSSNRNIPHFLCSPFSLSFVILHCITELIQFEGSINICRLFIYIYIYIYIYIQSEKFALNRDFLPVRDLRFVSYFPLGRPRQYACAV